MNNSTNPLSLPMIGTRLADRHVDFVPVPTGHTLADLWELVRVLEKIHVLPVYDNRRHLTRTLCWCSPVLQDWGRLLVIHTPSQ